ncbi:MAG: inorganic phosphate transporter [Spirochaetales bacterium]|nr:inorganic phosphate transporter [Spirochaetales bacterium]
MLIIAILTSLYMAWNIGANDVANSMGTSVGSGALTLKKAVIIAGVFEFLGAFLVGKHVTNTISKGIVNPALFELNIFAIGMLSSLIAASLWVTIATYLGLPVSTTQSIVGAIMGFSAVLNIHLICWGKVIDIVTSWIISPFSGALIAYIIFLIIKKTILSKNNPIEAAKKTLPLFIFFTFFVMSMSIIYKGLTNLALDFGLVYSLLISALAGLAAMIIGYILLRRYNYEYENNEDKYNKLEKLFIHLQVMTACTVAFAHGANDVANAAGPLATIVDIFNGVSVSSKVTIPLWVLVLGGAGIVLGISTWGYRVISTIGKKITEITPTRGFSAELSTAFIVLLFSKLGIPLSTSHVLVGSVLGVGIARGLATVNYKVIKNIIYSWILTIPIAMIFSAVIFLFLKFLFI